MVENKKIINSKVILEKFGTKSDIFKEVFKFLEAKANHNKKIFQNKFQLWKNIFKNIYGQEIDHRLFLKHSYFALILKIFIIFKLNNEKADFETLYQDVNLNSLDNLNFFEFSHFIWINLEKKLFKEIFSVINKSTFTGQDLFQELYQQMFFIITRHKIGEFYTVPELVKKMVDDIYKVGDKVLDPSCGSGSFLVEIIIKILISNYSINQKFRFIEQIYGFDINPLATLTAKVNILILLLESQIFDFNQLPKINVYLIDALFPEECINTIKINLQDLYNSFDLIIGNPPWLTYKDILNKTYQRNIRELANELKIKPSSQYITHIELAIIFFYFIPIKFLKINHYIFFVITKSVLNGDHCYKFRKFSLFDSLEIWDFPKNYFFNINHICLKARYIGVNKDISISTKYPISAKLFNENLELQKITEYNSIKIEDEGAKIIIPDSELRILNNLSPSLYKEKFLQGATLVPRTLVFFKINNINDEILDISSDSDVISRSKKNWKFEFKNRKVEKGFIYKTFLNLDLIPFYIKQYRNVLLPLNDNYEFDINYLKKFPKFFEFYNELNDIYKKRKKSTSKIKTLFANLNYWNKLSKQINKKRFTVVYNASGSTIKAAVIDNFENKIIIASENYYFSTDSQNEAYYLSSILNSPILSNNIKLIKSSRHIHKRPFLFPIPLYDDKDPLHRKLANKGKKYESVVQDLFLNNPKINSTKVRIFMNKKLEKLETFAKKVVFGV